MSSELNAETVVGFGCVTNVRRIESRMITQVIIEFDSSAHKAMTNLVLDANVLLVPFYSNEELQAKGLTMKFGVHKLSAFMSRPPPPPERRPTAAERVAPPSASPPLAATTPVGDRVPPVESDRPVSAPRLSPPAAAPGYGATSMARTASPMSAMLQNERRDPSEPRNYTANAAMLCGEAAFQQFLMRKAEAVLHPGESHLIATSDQAAAVMRTLLQITSRNEINSDPGARARFIALRAEYEAHQQSRREREAVR